MTRRLWLRAGTNAIAMALACHAAGAADVPNLQKGIDALNGGKTLLAVKLLSAEIEAPGRAPGDRSRALYFRAKAYLASGQPALAIADANAALYTRQLSQSEAVDAEAVRAKALKTAGIEMPAAATPSLPPSRAVRAEPDAAQPAPSSWGTSVAPSAPRQQKPALRATTIETAAPSTVEGAERKPAAPWAAERVTREELPAAIPAPSSAAAAVVASDAADAPPRQTTAPDPAMPGARAITTGSLPDADASPAPKPAADVIPTGGLSDAGESLAAAVSNAGKAVTGLLPSIIDGIGGFVAPSGSPVAGDIEAAGMSQKARAERIKAHNEAVAAGKPPRDETSSGR